MECPSLRRHQRGAETATGVPYDSVEEPKKKKNPLEREELKHRRYQKPEEPLGVRTYVKVVEARYAGDHEDYRTGRP